MSHEVLTALHEAAALGVCTDRQESRSEVVGVNEWLEGHHLVSKKIASRMGDLLADNNEGVVVARQMLRYLQSISLEEYKAIRAYLNWEERGGVIDEPESGKAQDWFAACNMVREYMNIPSFALCDQSFINYLEDCSKHSELIANRKAYWLHLTHPFQDSCINYQKANDFVRTFYDLNIIIPAVEGHNASGTIIKNLMLMSPEIVNMVEFNVFRIKKIQ